MEQTFNYAEERRKALEALDQRVAAYLLTNPEVSIAKAAGLFGVEAWQIKYIMRKAGLRRPAGRKVARG